MAENKKRKRKKEIFLFLLDKSTNKNYNLVTLQKLP